MYIAVRKIGNQWFRTDNGALVGTECSNIDSFYRYQNIIIKTEDGKFLPTSMGYIDQNNQFVPLCRGTCIAQNCGMHNTPICLHTHSIETTKGMYAFITD